MPMPISLFCPAPSRYASYMATEEPTGSSSEATAHANTQAERARDMTMVSATFNQVLKNANEEHKKVSEDPNSSAAQIQQSQEQAKTALNTAFITAKKMISAVDDADTAKVHAAEAAREEAEQTAESASSST